MAFNALQYIYTIYSRNMIKKKKSGPKFGPWLLTLAHYSNCIYFAIVCSKLGNLMDFGVNLNPVKGLRKKLYYLNLFFFY
jgi:hypothetical protein